MTIQRASLTIAVGLSTLFVAIVGIELIRVVRDLGNTRQMVSTVAASSTVSTATIELSLERSVMQVALNLDQPIAPQFRSLIDEQRRLSDEAFVESASIVADDRRLSRGEEFISRLAGLRSEIETLRAIADEELTLPLSERDAELVESLPLTMKATIEEFANLTVKLRERDVELPGIVTILEEIQRRAWEIREYGGRERTYLAIAAADGRPISDHRRGAMVELHARARFAMDMALILSDNVPADDEIRTQITDVYDTYFEQYGQIRAGMFRASDAGEPYPLDFDDFFRVSTDALQTAVTLSVASGERTLTILNRRQVRASVLLAIYAILLLVSVSLCAGQIRYTTRKISNRLTGLAGQMEVLASGDTSIDPSQYRAHDEIGRMAEALVTFRHNAVEKRNLEAQQREDAEEAIRQREETVKRLAERIERQTRSSIEAVAAKSDQLNDAARAMRDRLASMVESSSTVAHVAATTRESSDKARASVDDFNRALERINGELGHSKEAIDGASETVTQAGRAVSELSTRAESVAEVVRSIETVAEKTHLLSLNAAIEAARAGHSGRGFAVVAGEVKNLAASTGQFTQRIFGQIDDMREANEHVVRMMQEIAEGMQRVDSRSQEIFSTIEAQSAGTAAINQVLVENLKQAGLSAERVHELADAAEELRSLAGGLEELASDLDVQVSQIRGTINGLTDGSGDEAAKAEFAELVGTG